MGTEELHDMSFKLEDLVQILIARQIAIEDVLIERLAENLVETKEQK